jgi:hypothetical protein
LISIAIGKDHFVIASTMIIEFDIPDVPAPTNPFLGYWGPTRHWSLFRFREGHHTLLDLCSLCEKAAAVDGDNYLSNTISNQSWRRIRGVELIEQLLKGIAFKDGTPVIDSAPT